MQVVAVYLANGLPKYENSYSDSAIVNAYLSDANETSGFYELSVVQNEAVAASNNDQMLSAGFAEGYLTAELIGDFYRNLLENSTIEDYRDFAHKQYAYLAASDDPLLQLASYFLKGIYSGYSERCAELGAEIALDVVDFYILNSLSDYNTLSGLFGREYQRLQRHAAVYVRRAGGFVGHVQYGAYAGGFIRVVKTLSLRLQLPSTRAQELYYTSYPGCFCSADQFFVLRNEWLGENRRFVVSGAEFIAFSESVLRYVRDFNAGGETTNFFVNEFVALLNTLEPSDFLATFSRYNNYAFMGSLLLASEAAAQLMEFVPPAGQDAGQTLVADVPSFIQQNAPYGLQNSRLLGYSDDADDYMQLSYNRTAKKRIFERYSESVANLQDLQALLEYNDYTSVGNLQDGNPCDSISPRCDLLPEGAALYYGSLDAKSVDLQALDSIYFEVGMTRGAGPYEHFSFKEHNLTVYGVADVLPYVVTETAQCGNSHFSDYCEECDNNFDVKTFCLDCARGYYLINYDCRRGTPSLMFISSGFLTVCIIVSIFVYLRGKHLLKKEYK